MSDDKFGEWFKSASELETPHEKEQRGEVESRRTQHRNVEKTIISFLEKRGEVGATASTIAWNIQGVETIPVCRLEVDYLSTMPNIAFDREKGMYMLRIVTK